ncbi:hypothetical protein CTA1_7714 [Colletotrichum tanaceti]|uniref:Uncharacterized protein n=1 Tax=Colletotrichum tanaceti TaxID=1306861 RepID=A0A4U6X960_9PEZI|nr:hypothetical protein CTA1_7714 [Colletotrichum tanaceti]
MYLHHPETPTALGRSVYAPTASRPVPAAVSIQSAVSVTRERNGECEVFIRSFTAAGPSCCCICSCKKNGTAPSSSQPTYMHAMSRHGSYVSAPSNDTVVCCRKSPIALSLASGATSP